MVFVQDAFQERNVFIKLDKTMTLIHALDEDLKKRVKAHEFIRYIKDLETNDKFMRDLEYVSTIKDNIESSIEYFGYDHINSPDFAYRKDIEPEIREIKERLRVFLGNLIKELTKRQSFEI